MRWLKLSSFLLLGPLVWLSLSTTAFAFEGWLPITPEDLTMKSYAKAPGAAAIVLYRQIDRVDTGNSPHEFHYERIKILTEEGRKYADVEVPFNEFEVALNLSGLRGRTIHPDGKEVEFDGKVFDKTIEKTRDYKIRARTFTLPDVHAGDIIEYQYNLDLNERYFFDSKWILSSELLTRDAKFSLKPSGDYALRWSWPAGLPEGTAPPKSNDLLHVIAMETHNIPALPIEEFMPPLNTLQMRVEFSYSQGALESDPVKFWKNFGKKENSAFEGFISHHGDLQAEASSVVSPSDSQEAKARKLYARVQQIKNLSFERQKTAAEEKRDKEKENKNANDVLKQGSGYARQINWLYIGLARAAGLEATSVLVSGRSQFFIDQRLMNSRQLNDDVVKLKLDGKDVYVDPSDKFAPFGVIGWSATSAPGLALDRDGGTWIRTDNPISSENRIIRTANLKLADEGSLEGTLTVTYVGLSALTVRTEQRDEDDTAHKEFLEDSVKEIVPVGIEVELTNKPDWKTSSPQFVAEYKLKVPGWAASAGRRALVGMGLFSGREKHMFEHADRVNNIYFHYPYRYEDDVTITLPEHWAVTSTPPPSDQDGKAIAYVLKAEAGKGTIHISRTLRMDVIAVDLKNYGILRQFFQIVRTGDEQQAILQPGT